VLMAAIIDIIEKENGRRRDRQTAPAQHPGT
jgi:hypothetical protein